jgi:hypothetical protein
VVDLADIVRGEAARYLQTRSATLEQRKAMCDIVSCRTDALGSVAVTCDRCSVEYRLFRSCRNRSCPRCQGEARQKWLEARREEILPGDYLQVVFSAPAELNVLALFCPSAFYDAFIRAAGQAVIDVGWSAVQAQLGCQVDLQTWGQSMAFHPHAHCVVPCGGFSADGSRWVRFAPDDLPRKALSERFRLRLCQGIRVGMRQGKFDRLPESVSVQALLARVVVREWSVYARTPFGGPERLLAYLARYTYRVAITEERIESYTGHQVTFRWRDYRRGHKEKPCTLDAQEFLRRFLMHVPPRGFVRVRSYGFLGNRNRQQNLERARQQIGRTRAAERPESFVTARLCAACSERVLHFAPHPQVVPQFDLPLRPPPIAPAA